MLRTLSILSICGLMVLGCDDPGSGPLPPDGNTPPGPAPDAQVQPPEDTGPGGGGMDDGAIPDGSMPPPTDAGAGSPSDFACTAAEERVFKLGTDDEMATRDIAVAAQADGFSVLWTETREGRPDLFGFMIPSTATDESAVVDQTVTANFSREQRDIALVPSGSGYIGVWIDNEPDIFDLRAQQFDAMLSPVGARLTINGGAATELNPSLLRTTGGDLWLAWNEEVMDASGGIARSAPFQQLGSDGAPTGTLRVAVQADEGPRSIVLGEIGTGPVAFYGSGSVAGRVLMQPLPTAGAGSTGSGDAVIITGDDNADGSLDAAFEPFNEIGMVVFGTSPQDEIRVRVIDADGSIEGENLLTVMATSGRAKHPSIATFSGGFVVSYRLLGTTDDEPAEIRLMTLSVAGAVLEDQLVSGASSSGGRTTVRVSGDGQILVTWTDNSSEGTDLRSALVACSRRGS